MFAFFVSLLFGVMQAFLLKLLLGAVTAGDTKKMILFFAVKFVAYGLAIALLMAWFLRISTYCLCGFAVGLPVAGITIFVYEAYIKKV